MVGWRNPARYIVPLALAAAITATYLIVHHALVHDHTSSATTTAQSATVARHQGRATHHASTAKFYVVKPGDSLLAIAAKTSVPIATIEALNPHVNPNALHPSQRLRLRR